MVESGKAPSGSWKTYRAAFLGAITAIGVSGGAIWVVWQMSSSHHRAEIESLRQTLATVVDAYDAAARKMEGLLEPRLLTEDTLRAKKGEAFCVLACRKAYEIDFVDFRDDELHISFFSCPINETEKISLILRSGERHEFEFEERLYYVVFDLLVDGDSLIRARLYELKPLYSPAGR